MLIIPSTTLTLLFTLFAIAPSQPTSATPFSAEPTATQADNRALIIVAGRFSLTDRLQDNIHNVTNQVYQGAKAHNYSDDDIFYLATDSTLAGYDAAASIDNLQRAIIEWASQKIQSGGTLNLYLMDHGDIDRFYLDEVSEQRLTPDQFDGWLTELEGKIDNLKTNIVIEAVNAGSFISNPGTISGPGRVVIASTSNEGTAYASIDGAYFSDSFITSITAAENIGTSFQTARDATIAVHDRQDPWIDADGDGIHNEAEDITLAEQRYFLSNVPPIRTLILTNRSQLETLYENDEVTELMGQLDQLAAHSSVSGTVVDVGIASAVAEAYTAWQADLTSTELANAVADAIFAVIQEQSAVHTQLEYIVLVGDDRVIPFRRVPDESPQLPESSYKLVSETSTVGAALADDMFLTNDFYGDLQPTEPAELYIPELSVGRLVETPTEMQTVIEKFLVNNGEIPVSNGLVFGMDFIKDVAEDTCSRLSTALSPNTPTCITNDTWTASDLTSELQSNSAELLLLYTHANHNSIGTADRDDVYSDTSTDWRNPENSRLIYMASDHTGLNVPPDSSNPLDWPQVWMSKGDLLVGNTGYSWGFTTGIGLSERVAQLLTENTLDSSIKSVGEAVTKAKQSYIDQKPNLSAYDKKVVTELVVYGLPMYKIVLNSDESSLLNGRRVYLPVIRR